MSSGGAIDDAPALACDDGTDGIVQAVWRALGNVKDPCNVLSGHDLSIVDMGLVNRVQISGDLVEVGVTFTEPGCVFGYRIIEDMEDLAAGLRGVGKIQVIPEPFPLWDESRLSPKARSVYAEKKARFRRDPLSPSPITATEQSS